jgi:hypothetical protein
MRGKARVWSQVTEREAALDERVKKGKFALRAGQGVAWTRAGAVTAGAAFWTEGVVHMSWHSDLGLSVSINAGP